MLKCYAIMKYSKTKQLTTIFLITGMLLCSPAIAQNNIRGKVVYQRDARPASGASVILVRKHRMVVTDDDGNFSIHIPPGAKADTLLISSVGYRDIVIPVNEAIRRKQFALTDLNRSMPPVVVRSFTSREIFGDRRENVGYFRSWSYDSTGGEIGRIFRVPYPEYKIEKIQFKVSNTCKECTVRLRIRTVDNEKPGIEILNQPLTMALGHRTLDGPAPVFDLTPYDQTFKEAEIYISFELIGCSYPGKGCSFCFAGTEQGYFTYNSNLNSMWRHEADFAIYLKMFLLY